MSNEAQQFRDMAAQILSPIDSKGAALFRYAADAIDERDLLKSQNANSLGETQEQFKRTAHEFAEITQLRKEVERWTNNCAEAHLKLKEAQDERDSAIRDARAHIVSLNEAGKFTAQMAAELAKTHADGAVMRGAIEDCKRLILKIEKERVEAVAQCSHMYQVIQTAQSHDHAEGDESDCVLCQAIKTVMDRPNPGADLLVRYREAVELLREAAEEEQRRDWLDRRDALLATVKGEVVS